MGFNTTVLFAHIFGLIIPIALLFFFAFSKHRKEIAFDSVFYGIAGFGLGIVAAVMLFLIANMMVLSGITFESDDNESGLALAAGVLSVLIIIVYLVCETFKLYVIKKSRDSEERFRYSGLGYSAGVIIAQNAGVFVALNIIGGEELEAGLAAFTGIIVTVAGVMYTVISHACDIIYQIGSKAPAYALSFVYYFFWIAIILCSNSTVLIYTVSALIFVLAFVLSGVFVVNKEKLKRKAGESK